MATELRLVCDGCGAVTAFVRVAVTKGGDAVRGQARKGGWDCRKPRNIDLCPQCVAGGRAQQVVNERSKFINGDAAARLTPGQLKRGEQSSRRSGTGPNSG